MKPVKDTHDVFLILIREKPQTLPFREGPRQPPLSAWSTRAAAVFPFFVTVRVPPPPQAVAFGVFALA